MSKERTHNDEKTNSKQQSPRQSIENSETLIQHPYPVTTIQQARLEPHSLPPRNVQQLQRTIGNRAVGQLLVQMAHHPLPQNTAFEAKVIQRQYAQVNWNAMNQYNSGSAGKAVSAAFTHAGYTISEIPRLVVDLMNHNGFGKDRFGHASGDDTQGQQGDTTQKIETCKEFLIKWANSNPKASSSSSTSSKKHTPQQQEEAARKKEEKKAQQAKEKKAKWEEQRRQQGMPPRR